MFMKKLWTRVCLAVCAGIFVCMAFTASAHASVNDFVINQFDADYTLTNDDLQGQLEIKESISVDFSDQNHGILRALPNTYRKQNLHLQVDKVLRDDAPEQWTTYQSGGNTVLKIGDPGRTMTGVHTYVIEYTVRNVISFYDDHNELYWDINGDQWMQVAQHVSVIVRLPGAVEQQRDPICYTGSFGSTKQECLAGYNGFTNVLFAESTGPLQPGETLSLVGAFTKGYFYPPSWSEKAGAFIGTALKFLVPLVVIGGTAFRHWYRYGRDPKGKGVIVPEYEAPDGLKPIEVGTVADFRTDNRDITATIIDLAIRGYVTIVETVKERMLRKDPKVYSLRLENDSFTGLDEFEKTLLRGIFSKHKKGQEVDLASLKYKLSDTATELQSSVKKSLVARGYFRKTPLSTTLKFAGVLFLEFVVMVIFAVVVNGEAAVLGIAAGTAIAVICIILLPSRTPQGVAANESIQGLKLYLEVAEKERINKLQSPESPYAAHSSEPKKTVELFEKLLPFAIMLGVEQQWAKQFASIYTTPPNWYQGNWTTFNAVYLATALNSGVQTSVNSAFSSPSSSNGSGFSGGSAGGGGGGGGGGGW